MDVKTEDKKMMMQLAAQEVAMYQKALEDAYKSHGVKWVSTIDNLVLAYQNVVLGRYNLYDSPETKTPQVAETQA
jgi:hypothetical protein